jgi:hypothetical protein
VAPRDTCAFSTHPRFVDQEFTSSDALDNLREVAVEDDLVRIAVSGDVSPTGARAVRRLQARAGTFELLPSPPDYVVLRHASPDGTARRCLLSGEIRSAGVLCDVLSFVGHTGWRGEFLVHDTDEGISRSIFFEDGSVIAAQSTAMNERLGEVLYRYGVLTRPQVTASGDASADGSLRFGEAAVKLQFLTREHLFAHMGRQTEEIVYGMLLASRGVFYFLEGFDEKELSWRQPLSISALIREGIRRMHETKYFRARIPSDNYIPCRAQDRQPPNNDPLGVFAAVDGNRSIADLARVVRAGEFDVTRAVFQLVQSGHVSVRSPQLPPQSIVAAYNQAIGLILRELDAMDEGDPVRAQLVAFATKQGMTATLRGAGPADDGTLDGDRIAQNLSSAGVERTQRLADDLYAVASYALFLARPHLRRREATKANAAKSRVSMRVSELLEPITPDAMRKPGPKGAA